MTKGAGATGQCKLWSTVEAVEGMVAPYAHTVCFATVIPAPSPTQPARSVTELRPCPRKSWSVLPLRPSGYKRTAVAASAVPPMASRTATHPHHVDVRQQQRVGLRLVNHLQGASADRPSGETKPQGGWGTVDEIGAEASEGWRRLSRAE